MLFAFNFNNWTLTSRKKCRRYVPSIFPWSCWTSHSCILPFIPSVHLQSYSHYPHRYVLELVRNLVAHGDAREGRWRGNWQMEWVASTLMPPLNVVYPALLKLMRTPRLPAVDWTEAPTDLNGLVRFGERRNLVSACVPSRSARAILKIFTSAKTLGCLIEVKESWMWIQLHRREELALNGTIHMIHGTFFFCGLNVSDEHQVWHSMLYGFSLKFRFCIW